LTIDLDQALRPPLSEARGGHQQPRLRGIASGLLTLLRARALTRGGLRPASERGLAVLYLSALIAILGAMINSEMERQTARDTTHGGAQPPGQRGAYVADHLPDGQAATTWAAIGLLLVDRAQQGDPE